MSTSHYLGIDVGSGSVKVMLVNDAGAPVQTAAAGYETSYPYSKFVEQDPNDWYTAACTAVQETLRLSGVRPVTVRGIGLSGTSHVPSLLDADLSLIRPGILWNDQRSESQVERLGRGHADSITSKTMNTINCTWSMAQIAWIQENEPAAFDRVRHVLFSKDYLAYRLTGSLVSDYSSAFSSLFVAAKTLDWDPELAGLVGLTPEVFPSIHGPSEPVGNLTAQAATDLGLPQTVTVVAGVLDSAAELVGVGALDPSIAVIRLGTAGGVMTIREGPEWREGCLLYPHPVRPYWYHQAGTNSATTSVEWAKGVLGLEGEHWSYAELDRLVEAEPPGTGGLVFHPYLVGERAPHWSPSIRGGFSGATLQHGRAAFFRAVLEGVAFSLRDCTALVDWERTEQLRICGGGAKSRVWCQIIADVLGLPVDQMNSLEASAQGAALLAIAGCEGRSLSKISCGIGDGEQAQRIEPDEATRELYNSNYSQYRDIAAEYLRVYGGRSPKS